MSLLIAFILLFQGPTPIDIEMVRKDLLSREHYEPNDYIKNLKPTSFNVIYAGNWCFVHLPYKSNYSEPHQQTSDVMVYRMVDGRWTFDNHTLAWYDLKLLDAEMLLFLSETRFCDNDGKCRIYTAVSHYEANNFFVYREYKGLDRKLYFEKLKTAKNQKDTIVNTLGVKDFNITEHQTSFTLVKTFQTVAKPKNMETYERIIINY